MKNNKVALRARWLVFRFHPLLTVVLASSLLLPLLAFAQHHGTTTVDYSAIGDSVSVNVNPRCLTDVIWCYPVYPPIFSGEPSTIVLPVLPKIRINHSDPPSGIFSTCQRLASWDQSFNNGLFTYRDSMSGWIQSRGDETNRLDKLYFYLNRQLCSFNDQDYGWLVNFQYSNLDPSGTLDERPNLIWPQDVQTLCFMHGGQTVSVHKTLQAFLNYSNGDTEAVGPEKSWTMNLNCPPCPPLGNQPVTLDDAHDGAPYYQYVPIGRGFGIKKWAVNWVWGENYPEGLTFKSDSGLISGTPLQAGSYTFGVTVTDSCPYGKQSVTIPVTLKVDCRPFTPHTVTLPAASEWQEYSFELSRLPGLWTADLGGSFSWGS